MSESDPYFVPTRSSNVKKTHAHEVVIHTSEGKKDPTNDSLAKPLKKFSPQEQELSMKQARFEVYKFAQSSLSSTDKQKSRIELAIKLGAKPPKQKCINYKNLKENKKKEFEEAKLQKELHNIPIHSRISQYKSKINKGTLRQKRKIGSGILNVYGKVTKRNMRK